MFRGRKKITKLDTRKVSDSGKCHQTTIRSNKYIITLNFNYKSVFLLCLKYV